VVVVTVRAGVGAAQGRLEMALYTILAICPLVALLNCRKYLPGQGSPGPPQSSQLMPSESALSGCYRLRFHLRHQQVVQLPYDGRLGGRWDPKCSQCGP
jgi:hypothetical protein